MSDPSTDRPVIPQQQQAIRDKCFHPTGTFIEFRKEEIEQSIPDRFEEQVRRYPDRLAIKTRTLELTYDELNKAANRVAHAILAQRGMGQEPVGLLLENGITFIAAILGVLKAGKIYMAAPSSFPRTRITYMLEDSQAGLIVTDNQNLSLARELVQDACSVINVDELGSGVSDKNTGLSISPDSLASITYTSGSTGQPKGVVTNHRNVLHLIMNYTNSFHVCPDDRCYSLNARANDIFSTLLNGASLYTLDIKEEGLDKLVGWLVQHEITNFYSVSTVYRHFLEALTGKERFPNLRLIKLYGEPASKRDTELYKKYFSQGCIFVSSLGTTETGTFRQYFIDKGTPISSSTVPVGYAVEDKEVLLLDETGEQVGFNGVGEIAVKSRYLGLGYWRRPDLTQATFLPDQKEGDERIYLTGDLGLMRPDGCLIHMGRKDFQVKIRGHRVEVTEIEIALLELDDVKEAVVVAREDQAGGTRLVAYLVPAMRPAPTISELRSYLEQKLPDYMVPSAFVMLDALPALPNGKLDRTALPDPGHARPELANAYVAPRTPVEIALAEVWAEVLRLDQVGVHDNFLELGGDSLLAGQVISRVINTFRVELPLQSLFQAPTVADMALAITQRRAKAADQAAYDRMLVELEALTAEKAKELLAGEGSTGISHEQS